MKTQGLGNRPTLFKKPKGILGQKFSVQKFETCGHVHCRKLAKMWETKIMGEGQQVVITEKSYAFLNYWGTCLGCLHPVYAYACGMGWMKVYM